MKSTICRWIINHKCNKSYFVLNMLEEYISITVVYSLPLYLSFYHYLLPYPLDAILGPSLILSYELRGNLLGS